DIQVQDLDLLLPGFHCTVNMRGKPWEIFQQLPWKKRELTLYQSIPTKVGRIRVSFSFGLDK
ncbi:hypothetical protein J6590_090856, partial [Homalodisca vitripennis]